MNIKKTALSLICFAALSAGAWAATVTPVVGVWPAMVRQDYNPILQLDVHSNSERLTQISLDFSGTTNPKNIKEVTVYIGGTVAKKGTPFGKSKKFSPKMTFNGSAVLEPSDKIFVSVELVDKVASMNDTISVAATSVKIGSGAPAKPNKARATQRIGYTIAKPGDCNSKFYRIPAVTQTKNGTLLAVFDIRYNHSGDLPANIDVGLSRSTDGGKTWSKVEPIMTSKGMSVTKGVGDPGILYDAANDTVWVSGLWAPASGHPIFSSSTGTTDPKLCGQMLLVKSTNDGKSWSKPENITNAIKRLNNEDTSGWGLVFQGPGAGIALKDGTLVFPAQVWGNKGKGTWGVLVYSKDGGKTWTSSKQMPWGGSESTCVQLADGSVMLNVRQGSAGARIVGVTKDLGETWTKFEGEPLRQPANLCQAALWTNDGKKLYFSNPNSGKRDNMTIKCSKDGGKTWNAGLLYDDRGCAGYSSLCTVDADHIGIVYEGSPGSEVINFLSIPYSDIEKVPRQKKGKK